MLRRISLTLHASSLPSEANSVATVPTWLPWQSDMQRDEQCQIQGRCLRGCYRNEEHLCAGHVHDCASCGEASRMCQYHAVLGIFCSEKCMADQLGIRRSSIGADNTPWVDANWHGGPRCQSYLLHKYFRKCYFLSLCMQSAQDSVRLLIHWSVSHSSSMNMHHTAHPHINIYIYIYIYVYIHVSVYIYIYSSVCVYILLGPLTLKIAWQLRCLGCQNQALILNETDITIGPPHAGLPVPIPIDPVLFPHLYHDRTAKLETHPSSAGRAAASSGDAALPSPMLVPPRATRHFPIGSLFGDGVPEDARRESALQFIQFREPSIMKYRFRTCLPT